jgi:hypothetical protein
MKRIVVAAVPFLAVAMIVAGTAGATSKHKVTCQQIRAELEAGKKPADVAKEFKISRKAVDHCNAKVASTKKQHSTHGAAPAPQSAPAQ